MSYLVLDIETVPDLKLWQPPKPEVVVEPLAEPAPDIQPTKKSRAKKPPKPPKAPEDVFAPLYAHKIVAIGFTQLDDDLNVQAIGCVGTRTFGDNETDLLRAFSGYAERMQPTLVTFAGRTFDIPVINLRAMHRGVSQGWYTGNHRHRYGDDHIDVFDQLTEHGAVQRAGFGLDPMCALIGLPGKGSEVNGSKVAGLMAAGQAAKVEEYCSSDTVKTAFLMMRIKLLRGLITIERYREVAQELFQKCIDMRLMGVTFGANPQLLLLPGEEAQAVA
jgi:predicted PolB exonuclease-like 3'-5' exonuclease